MNVRVEQLEKAVADLTLRVNKNEADLKALKAKKTAKKGKQ